MISFKKNLFTVILAITLVLIGSWLVGIPRSVIIDGMTLVIATMVMTLMIEDFWRKMLTSRELLTWQYFVGALIISGSVMAWLWASESTTTQEMAIRLAVTFLCGGLGGVWMAIPYRTSVEPEKPKEDRYVAREQKKWSKWRQKIEKSAPEDKIRHLGSHLRFYLVGNTIGGDLDIARPLCLVKDELLTLDEMKEQAVDIEQVKRVETYLASL